MFIFGRLLDKFLEQAVSIFVFHTFRMPLNANYKGMIPGLDTFNYVFFRTGINIKLLTHLFYRLMVETIHLYSFPAQDLK